jgi:hypothetical protein
MYGSQKTVDPQEFDPLYSKSGGAELRQGIFGALPGAMGRATQQAENAIGAAQRGAAEMGAVGKFGRSVLRGDYMRNPTLDASLAASRRAGEVASRTAAADARANMAAQQAATRSQFGRAGQGFGTANQLAQEGTAAAMGAQINRAESARLAQQAAIEAQAQAENVARERGFQMQAPGIVSGAATKPVELLQAVPGLTYAGVSPAVEIIRGLASGSPVVNPNTYYKPGVGDYMLQGAGALGALGGAMY